MPTVPTDEQVAYMLAHPDDNVVANVIACASVCGIASIVFLILRFVAQGTLSKGRLSLSDYLLILGWVFFALLDICFALTTKYGLGKHIIYATDVRMIQILNITDEITYCFSMAFIKLSILSFYASIFPSRRFHYCLWALAALLTVWTISLSIVAIVQCIPIEYGWDLTIAGGHCLNYGLVVLVAQVFTIVTDLTILCMPIPLTWKLHMSRQKKVLLCFTFAMGGSACIVSIVRLGYTLRVGTTADGTWDIVPAGQLSVAELMSGILAACLPTYRPLYKRLFTGSSSTTKRSAQWQGSEIAQDGSRTISVMRGSTSGNNRRGINITNQIELAVHVNNGGSWVRVPDEVEHSK